MRSSHFGGSISSRETALHHIHRADSPVRFGSFGDPKRTGSALGLGVVAHASHTDDMNEFLIKPDPLDPRLTRRVAGRDHEGREVETAVTMERPLTLFLNGQEIVTMMTIGDYPDYLAVGYLLNQNMLRRTTTSPRSITTTTSRRSSWSGPSGETDYEDKLKKKTLTSGCAQGTVFGDLMEKFEEVALPRRRASSRPRGSMRLSKRKINTDAEPLSGGRRHSRLRAGQLRIRADLVLHGGCRPPQRGRQDRRLHADATGSAPEDKIFYTTGRSDQRDGHQDRQNGYPDPGFTIRIYRVGGRSGPPGRVDLDRAHERQTISGTGGRRAVGL